MVEILVDTSWFSLHLPQPQIKLVIQIFLLMLLYLGMVQRIWNSSTGVPSSTSFLYSDAS